MLNVWTLKSGSSLGLIPERVRFEQVLPTLPLVDELAAVTFSVISGSLPRGLRLSNNKIVGTPFEVRTVTESKFVIRATLGSKISDRTFSITVEGPDDPVWITPQGDLAINPNGQAFVLDNTYVDFDLFAIDPDIKAGDSLEFFIQEGDGQIPPGLTLSKTGKISGKISPILALDAAAGTGFFDTNLFDSNPFDFGQTPIGGFDNLFLYDQGVYDFIAAARAPKKLNRKYEFYASVTDGLSVVKRRFSIFVISDDFLRADNVILKIGVGAFTADATYLRKAFWLSASNLGIKRANNFVTLILDAFDPRPDSGPLVYELASSNPDNTASVLPEGLFLDPGTGEVFGFIPYQPAITIDYKFTVNAIKYDGNAFTETDVAVVVGVNANYGQNYLLINPLPAEDVELITGQFLRIGNYQYKVESYTSQVVYGGQFAFLRLDVPLKIDVPARDPLGNSTVFTKRFITNTLEFNTVISPKTFELRVLGEVDSVIKFITPKNIGTIEPNVVSTLAVVANTNVPRAVLSYRLLSSNIDGTASKLPTGMTLNSSGELIGKARQFGDSIVYQGSWKGSLYDSSRVYKINDVVTYNNSLYKCIVQHVTTSEFSSSFWIDYTIENFGLTLFDQESTVFDGKIGFFDRSYKFSVFASDQFKYSAIVGEFIINVSSKTNKLYSTIFTQPYQKIEKRRYFNDFINDTRIFEPNRIYRLNDPAFGIQKDLRMLVYAGVETRSISEYVPFLNKNIKRKRFKMGELKTAVAKLPGSNDAIYEVVYIEVIDDQEANKKSTELKIKLPNNRNSKTLVNQARSGTALGDLSIPENQLKLNFDEPDRFRPVKDPYTADNTSIYASGQDIEFAYPSSLINIRKNLRNLTVAELGDSTVRAIEIENEFLPLWMKTSQDRRSAATGFINAIPLCYCKPGEGQYILSNIKNSEFDPGLIDYEIDRFLIDSTLGDSKIQVLKFTNYRYNV
jgi:hypothetical protein